MKVYPIKHYLIDIISLQNHYYCYNSDCSFLVLACYFLEPLTAILLVVVSTLKDFPFLIPLNLSDFSELLLGDKT